MNETTILVIEDDKTIQNFMKISLRPGDIHIYLQIMAFPAFRFSMPTIRT